MAKIIVKLECEKCLQEFEMEIERDASNIFNIEKYVIRRAVNTGWHVGARTLCPECRDTDIRKCRTCVNRENKSMCPPTCKVHNCIVHPEDFCTEWKGLHD